jgi:hypothetical protein
LRTVFCWCIRFSCFASGPKNKVDGDKLFEVINASDLPNLAKPKRENLIAVDAIPALGSGKTDFQRIKKIAAES